MRYVILLRGVNVGGVTVKMAELRELLEARGYGEVRTVLASGNALVTSDASADTVKADVEAALRAAFGYDAWVQVLTTDALRAIVDAYPFTRGRDGWHDYVMFVLEAGVRDALLATELDPAHERAASGDGVVYWTVPKGDTLDSALGKATGKAAYKPHLTVRNVNTLEKLLG
ncbi:MAG: pyridoxamine 5-phosphate oxidase [Leifsonia xyli]|nr:MAG: pyridoxamine 5-phosphate oxidase [Leifsonia xyli]